MCVLPRLGGFNAQNGADSVLEQRGGVQLDLVVDPGPRHPQFEDDDGDDDDGLREGIHIVSTRVYGAKQCCNRTGVCFDPAEDRAAANKDRTVYEVVQINNPHLSPRLNAAIADPPGHDHGLGTESCDKYEEHEDEADAELNGEAAAQETHQ